MEETLDVVQLWKDIEDQLAPSLHFHASERCLYYHLLRHSRLLGRREIRTSQSEIGRQLGFSYSSVREVMRNMVRRGCIRVLSRSNAGQFLEVLLPGEILDSQTLPLPSPDPSNPLKDPAFRETIWRRDGGRCFYCLRKLYPAIAVLDHIVPRSQAGDDSPGNLAACCHDCNTEKSAQPAADFLRDLYRTGRLTAAELDERLAALRALREAPPVTLSPSTDPG